MQHVSPPSSDVTPRTAFLEFGSTTIKFYLVATAGERAGEVEDELKVAWDLGYDVFQHQRISPSTVARCTATLRDLQARYPNVAFETVTAVGTAALREAQNAAVFQKVIREELGLRLHVIEGGIEAFLLETGFRPRVEAFPTGVFDLGGGSIELVEFLSAYATKKTSLPLGAIRLHCQIRHTRDLFSYVEMGRQIIFETLREHFVGKTPSYAQLIGTGGTVRTVAQLIGREEMTVEDVRQLIDREIRGEIYAEVSRHRRKVLLPGLVVVEGLFRSLCLDRIVYQAASVKRGLIHLTSLLPQSADGMLPGSSGDAH
ncbi:MAG: hypothetical protein MK538_15030 [Planctomycetes bacterium]|nr:hypothetical protein [Planctomycetota bacterium]